MLKNVVDDKTVDGKLYPYWKHRSGHHARMLVIDIVDIVDAAGIISDSTDEDIKHLILSKQPIWDLPVLNSINDVKTHLRRT
ncbi:hypothetical protein [Absidia glauca]|uniref:Uncharacterized protein n=1 Tax=Absidia glauca TaxID=4829 RepID=A0A163TGE2_ABSGL|nr:hypothetical protein [Absidia glauca]